MFRQKSSYALLAPACQVSDFAHASETETQKGTVHQASTKAKEGCSHDKVKSDQSQAH